MNKMQSQDLERCESKSPMQLQAPATCLREKGHKGAHTARLNKFQVAVWNDVMFKLEFIEEKK